MSAVVRVVVVTPDIVGSRMAGPGMRAHHFASRLATEFDTALVARHEGGAVGETRYEAVDFAAANEAIEAAGILIGQPSRELVRAAKRKRVIFDLFDPVALELRELYGAKPTLRQRIHLAAEEWRLGRALRRGARLITAFEGQTSYYSRISRVSGSKWLAVPFGVERAPEARVRKDEPPLLLWGGGVWAWLDPELAIEAVEEVNRRGIACRLAILGGARPAVAAAHEHARARLKAQAEASRYVTWIDSWIDYEQRWWWLHRAKIAIMLHRRTPEAGLSIRTRFFDAIGAAVPVIASDGGFAAELTRARQLGLVVEPESRESVVAAIISLLTDDDLYSAAVCHLTSTAEAYRWERVTEPLLGAVREIANNE